MKRLGRIEVEVMRQAWRDHSAGLSLDRPSVAVAAFGWEDLGSRYTVRRFDREAIAAVEYKSGHDRIYQAVRRLREVGYLEGEARNETLTEEGRKVARSLFPRGGKK